MENRLLFKWQGREGTFRPKGNSWYIAIAIVAVGLAIAAAITKDYLFAVIAILGGFTLMVVGSRRPGRKTYAFSEHTIAIGSDTIPYEKITRFAIKEGDPKELTLETKTLIGIINIPLDGTDHRRVRTELKNHDIDEVEALDGLVGKAADWMGL